MIRRFHSLIATYLSTNHPVLWVTRIDVAVAMAVAVAAVSAPIVWAAGTVEIQWSAITIYTRTDINSRCAFSERPQNIQYVLQALALGLGAAAAFLWFGAVYRSAYKAVAPAMRIYPRVIDLFAALAIVGLAAATAAVAIELVMNMKAGECTVAGRELDLGEGRRAWVAPPSPWWPPRPLEIAGRYLAFMIEPALILATVFALILRWSVVVALALTAAPPVIAFFGIWFATVIFSDLSEYPRVMMTVCALTLVALACLIVPLWTTRSRTNSMLKRILVGASIPTCLLAVAGLEFSVAIAVNQLRKRGHLAGFEVLDPTYSDYWVHIFFMIHSVLALFFVQWIYVRWARMSLRPE